MTKTTETLNQNNPDNEQDSNKKFITIGVSFRTDSYGNAHEQDLKFMQALNNLGLNFKVEVKALPTNATIDSASREIENIQKDLQDVDLLYIPGSPHALESQIATTDPNVDPQKAQEEEEFKKVSVKLRKAENRLKNASDNLATLSADPKKDTASGKKKLKSATNEFNEAQTEHNNAKRQADEYNSREPYEKTLIAIAKTRGMVILGICAGSWRLLESYNGVVSTLATIDRAKHIRISGNTIGTINHNIEIERDSMLGACLAQESSNVLGINSVHWATPKVDPNDPQKLEIRQPDMRDLLKINAFASTNLSSSNTPEGFETLFGAPNFGLQFHPEQYLPGMQNEASADDATKRFAKQIFAYAAKAAFAYKAKREFILTTPGLIEPQQLLQAYKTPIEELYRQGCDYYHGNAEKGILVDMSIATDFFQRAAQHIKAQSKLGDIFEHGRSGSQDMALAIKYYKSAAYQGELLAMFSLGLCYENGKGVDKDIFHAAKLFQAAYDRGYEGWTGYFKTFLEHHPQVQGYLNAEDESRFSKIKATLTPAEHAQKGLNYYHGNKCFGIESNMRLAAGHLRVAAENGDSESQCLLGDILEHGRGISINLAEAITFYRQAAEQQDPSALFALGHCYELGKGVEKDLECAAEYYKSAFSKGYEGWKGYFKGFIDRNPSLINTPSLLRQYNHYCTSHKHKHKIDIIEDKIVHKPSNSTL